MASLAVGNLHLEGPTAYAVLEAANEKNREGSEVPLRADLADDLRLWLAEQAAGDDGTPTMRSATPLFAIPDKLVRVFDRDLKAQ